MKGLVQCRPATVCSVKIGAQGDVGLLYEIVWNKVSPTFYTFCDKVE